MQVEKRHNFLHLKFYSHRSIILASAQLWSVFLAKKRVFRQGALKNQPSTPSNLVQHEKLTLYANFHALLQIRRVLFFKSWTKSRRLTPTFFPTKQKQNWLSDTQNVELRVKRMQRVEREELRELRAESWELKELRVESKELRELRELWVRKQRVKSKKLLERGVESQKDAESWE